MKRLRILVMLVFCMIVFNSHAASQSFVKLSGSDSPTAIILIGGLDKGYQFFKRWEPSLIKSGASVYGFDDNFRSTTLQDSSWYLAVNLSVLANEGKTNLILISYSLGGLVAKHALHRMAWHGTLLGFKKVELHAMGSPWGGSFFANILPYLPFNTQVLDLVGYRMLTDLGSESNFMRSLEDNLPSNVSFYLYEGEKDTVSKAKTDRTKSRYESIASSASFRTSFTGGTHRDFSEPFRMSFDY